MSRTHFALIPLLLIALEAVLATIHGKYSGAIESYHLVVPHRATADGQFHSFHLPYTHAYDSRQFMKRRKRQLEDPDALHYGIQLNKQLRHVELWPNRDFLHPQTIIERRDISREVNDRDVRGLKNKKMCYYLGRVRGEADSRAVLSTCDGLLGYVRIGRHTVFIEPAQGHGPNKEGHHLHVVYQPSEHSHEGFCGVNDTASEWDAAMKERFKEELRNGDGTFKRALEEEVGAQYIEIFNVCDKRMIVKHRGHRDIEHWVLTLFSVVKSFYSESTMTFIIQPVLVRVVFLEKEEEEVDLNIQRNFRTTMVSVCKWANALQPKDPTHPNHFDIIVFISDWDFCEIKTNDCSVRGFANMCAACTLDRNCALAEDAGLETSVSIAHEIGHLVGMTHDGSPKVTCPDKDPEDNSAYVMSAYNQPFTVRWSPCSLASMHLLAREHVLDCFKDEPNNDEFPLFDELPGVLYDKDEQCKTHWRKSHVVQGYCDMVADFKCRQMLCKRPDPKNETLSECFGDGWAFAAGTTCKDETQWCIRTKCVPKGTLPESTDGGWSDWSDWSACSRTCGRGIMSKERVCNNPKPVNQGRYCVGTSLQRRLCNTQDCPLDTPAFREVRCKADLKGRKDIFLNAAFNESVPCTSLCLVDRQGTEVNTMAATIIMDGAKCAVGNPLKMCIAGICTEIPCDNNLEGSTAVVDACGTCNGDGTMCKLVEGDDIGVREGFPSVRRGARRMVTVVPVGARSVKIWNTDRCETWILLGGTNNNPIWHNFYSFLEGIYPLPPSNLTFFKYTRAYNPKNDTIQSEQRTIIWDRNKEEVGIYLAYFNTNTDVTTKWRWMEPTTTPQFEPVYKWTIAEFEPCSAKCGGGVQEPKLRCYEQTAGLVSAHFCEKMAKPTEPPQKCNEQPCKPEWKVGEWGKCRACRKKGGVRIRSVECVRANPKVSGDDILVEDSECTDEKPGVVELCATRKKCVPRTRKSIFVPGQFQGAIWQQMHKLHLIKRGVSAHPLAHVKNSTTATTPFTWTPPPVSDLMNELVVDEADPGDPMGDLRVGQEIVQSMQVVHTNRTEGDNAMLGPDPGTIVIVGPPILETTPFVGPPNSTAPCAKSGTKP